MKELTKAEEQVMQVLWDIERGVVADVIERLPDPKPAYNTISTIVRILEKKQMVGHEADGRSHIYYPLISKKQYAKNFLRRMVKGYFADSYREMVSFFSRNENLDIEEMEQMMKILQTEIENRKTKK